MNAHFLQHVPFEGLGSIEGWLRRRHAMLTSTRFFLNEPLPNIRDLDFIIAGPGPMSVNDEARLPWLKAEKQFLRDAITRGIPVLGICLGAQLIASSLGARVYPNPLREIGWLPIQAEKAPDHCFQFTAECTVFHWHGETFELPKDAVRLARSPACDNQGFQLGRNVIGLQFHLETTPESAATLIEHSRHEMIPGPYVQSEAQIRAVLPETYAAVNSLMNDLLNYLVRTTG
jgi:GMP synthase-like glutamine amidotransferase